MAKIIIALAAVAVLFVVNSWAQTCGPNEEYSNCVTSCSDYCNKGDDYKPCTLECRTGCKCAAGFTREAVDSSRCISDSECRRMRKCGNNKEFRTCGTACPKYCGQPDDVICPKICVAECQCKEGYVLLSKNSHVCIPENQCPQ